MRTKKCSIVFRGNGDCPSPEEQGIRVEVTGTGWAQRATGRNLPGRRVEPQVYDDVIADVETQDDEVS